MCNHIHPSSWHCIYSVLCQCFSSILTIIFVGLYDIPVRFLWLQLSNEQPSHGSALTVTLLLTCVHVHSFISLFCSSQNPGSKSLFFLPFLVGVGAACWAPSDPLTAGGSFHSCVNSCHFQPELQNAKKYFSIDIIDLWVSSQSWYIGQWLLKGIPEAPPSQWKHKPTPLDLWYIVSETENFKQ